MQVSSGSVGQVLQRAEYAEDAAHGSRSGECSLSGNLDSSVHGEGSAAGAYGAYGRYSA